MNVKNWILIHFQESGPIFLMIYPHCIAKNVGPLLYIGHSET